MSSGRIYTFSWAAAAKSAAFDVFELLAGSGVSFKVHRLELWQLTELGDAAEEWLQLTFKRATGAYTSGSTGETVSAWKHNPGDATDSITEEGGNTSQAAAGSGALTTLGYGAWNVRSGYDKVWLPEDRPVYAPSTAFIVSCAAPADSITVGASITVEELG